MSGIVFLALLALAFSEESSCPCIDVSETLRSNGRIDGGCLNFMPADGGSSYCYPVEYGSSVCDSHDETLEPFCASESGATLPDAPSWCFDEFCYVDPLNCDKTPLQSSFFPDDNIYYSYETCGSQSSFETWYGVNAEDDVPLCQLLVTTEEYLRITKRSIEAAFSEIPSASRACDHIDSCSCTSCSSLWGGSLDLSNVAVTKRPVTADAEETRLLTCMAGSIRATYLKVAAKEHNDPNRIGYQYFGEQYAGGLVQWPASQWCPGVTDAEYDPRFRPWYAAAASGPKSIILVIDRSASMNQGSRMSLAHGAAEAVIDTLTEFDRVSVVVFDSTVVKYSTRLVFASDSNKAHLKEWLNDELIPQSTTNFRDSLLAAFEIFRDTPGDLCKKTILFLTDGDAELDIDDLQDAHDEVGGAAVFTYALGDGANTNVTKSLACRFAGIFHAVPDDGDLRSVMATYYTYYASDLYIPRWVMYNDAITDTFVISGCLPVFDRRDTNPRLLGVTCLDVNVLVNMAILQSHKAYDNLITALREDSEECIDSALTECHIEKLRAQVSAESVCGTVDPDVTCTVRVSGSPDPVARTCPSWPAGFNPICENNVQDGDETGVDCGGSCPECPDAGPAEDGDAEEVVAVDTGIIVAVLAGIAICVAIVFAGVFFLKRKQKREEQFRTPVTKNVRERRKRRMESSEEEEESYDEAEERHANARQDGRMFRFNQK